jgi:hypothetical protein
MLENPTVLGALVFLAPFALAAVLPRGHRWVLGVGVALAVAWWAVSVAQGCDESSEVRCGWQPVLFGIAVIFYLGLWAAGTGLGLALGRRWRR